MNYNIRLPKRKLYRSFFASFLFSWPIFIWIIILTSLISLAGFILFSFAPALADYFALVPLKVINGENLWTLITHIFFHANIFHLFVNMFSLFFIGSITETLIGRKRFFSFYIFAGLSAGVFFVLLAKLGSAFGGKWLQVLGDLNIAGVGASGALFGLIGILAILIPRKKVYLIVGPIILIILQVLLPNWISGAFLAVLDVALNILLFAMIFSLFLPNPRLRKLALPIEMPLWIAPIVAIIPLVAISFYVSLPIGNSAHFGGLIAGLIYGIYLRLKYPKRVSLIEKYLR
ncbi:MAG: rhomboid family intramembrane serine protease [Nanoarchaeota archaeon]